MSSAGIVIHGDILFGLRMGHKVKEVAIHFQILLAIILLFNVSGYPLGGANE